MAKQHSIFFCTKNALLALHYLIFIFLYTKVENLCSCFKKKKAEEKKELDLTKNPVYRTHTSRVCPYSGRHLCDTEQRRPPVVNNNRKPWLNIYYVPSGHFPMDFEFSLITQFPKRHEGSLPQKNWGVE